MIFTDDVEQKLFVVN